MCGLTGFWDAAERLSDAELRTIVEHLSGRRNWSQPLWNALMFQAWRTRWCGRRVVLDTAARWLAGLQGLIALATEPLLPTILQVG